MAKKRKNGEGSWGKKNIKGVMYHYFRDVNGHYTYAKTERELREKLERAKGQKHLVQASNKLTVGEYMKDWLYNKKFKEVGVSMEPTTFDSYEASLTKRLYDYPLANYQLAALDKNTLMKYLKTLAEQYSRGSIKKTWQVLVMAFTDEDYALHDYVPDINFKSIKTPTEKIVAVKKKDHNFTSNEDMETLYNEALRLTSNDTYYYGNAARLLAFIMYSGLRVAEASGLKWKDVDLESQMITISQTYNITHNRDEHGNSLGWEYIEKSPKSSSSKATIPYRKRGGDILMIMDEMFPHHKKSDFVFLSNTGTPFTKRHVLHTLKRMLKQSGLEDRGYTVHDLRHGYGSILYQEGVDILTISKLLRHKDIQTTANIYVTTTPDVLKNVLDRIDKGDSN